MKMWSALLELLHTDRQDQFIAMSNRHILWTFSCKNA